MNKGRNIALFTGILLIASIVFAYPYIGLNVYWKSLLTDLGVRLFVGKDVDFMKMIFIKWGLFLFVGLFYLKNKWLKVWMAWMVFCLATQHNQIS